METFEVDGPLQVSVECAVGEVRVTTADALRAEVEVRALRDDEASRDVVANTRVELRGGDLVIEVPKKNWSFFGRDPQLRVEVTVPHDSALAFTTASADVRATGRYAEVRGRTASGDVTLTEAASVRIETASGDLRVDDMRSGGRLHAVSGDIHVGQVSGDVDVNAVSGDIDLAAVTQGAVEVRSVSGDVTVGVPPGVRVHVDVTTVSGDLTSEVDLNDAPAGDDTAGPSVAIRGKTVSGDLRVRRAAMA